MNGIRHFFSLAVCIASLYSTIHARADIYRWDNGEVIPGTEGIVQGPGAQLDHRALSFAALDSTNLASATFEFSNLTHARLSGSTLSNASLRGANAQRGLFVGANLDRADLSRARLRDANFQSAYLANSDFEHADVRGARFNGSHLTQVQLYSTESYRLRSLQGVHFGGMDLTGWTFAGQDLRNASFFYHPFDYAPAELDDASFIDAIVTGVDFSLTTLSKEQLYSTRSYGEHNLRRTTFFQQDLNEWDFRLQDLTGARFQGVSLGDISGAIVTQSQFYGGVLTKEQLYSTASYAGKNLQGLDVAYNDMAGWSLVGQDLRNARFVDVNFADANFTDALINGAEFTSAHVLTKEQLYSTASYKMQDLKRVGITGSDLRNWDFTGQNLTNADLSQSYLDNAIFQDADLSGADLRANFVDLSSAATTKNTILSNDSIHGLTLDEGESLVLRPKPEDWPAIRVLESAVVDGGEIEWVLGEHSEGAGSTIAFEPGIPVVLNGTLTLTFERNVKANDLLTYDFGVGRTYRLFDWTGVLPTGTLEVTSPYEWDLTHLFDTGEVTLIGVPEPSGRVLMIVTAALLIGRRVAGRLRSTTLLGFVAVGALSWIAPARCETFTLSEATVVGINRAFDSGVLTSERLVQLYFNRIEAYDNAGPQLSSFIAINSAALQTARALDQERRTSGPRSPLHGIPVVLKDNIDTFDMPTTYGCLALEGSTPPDDAFLVKRLRDAGAIVLGKTNLDEFGAGLIGRSSLGGQTRDAYDVNRVPLGSSGGTGVAIAANFATLGFGADAIGSVRMPSSASSLVGLKPTLGLVSRDGLIAYDVTREMAGPMARTVADVAIALDVVAGYDPADPTTTASQGHIPASYLDSLHAGSLQQARLGKVTYAAGGRTNPMRNLAEAAYQELQGLGAELTGPVDVTFMPDWYATLFDSFEYDLNRYLESVGPAAPVKSFDELVASGKYLPSLDGYFATVVRGDTSYADDPVFLQLLSQRDSLREQLIGIMDSQGLDALVYPTFPREPALTSVEDRVWTEDYFDNMTLAAFLGLPAITVPAGFTPDGLPLGIEFLGRPFSEPELLSFAYDFEQATHYRQPPSSTPALRGETLVLGDTNGDGLVNLEDLNNIRNNFGGVGSGDTNNDGIVDLIDLNNVRNFFGISAPQAVPEPSSLALLALGATGIIASRRMLTIS